MNKIEQSIESQHLLDKNKKYIVALSGGADSVTLLLALHRLGYQVEAAHCNFHLRGEESDRDEQFCKDLCTKVNVSFYFTHFDTKEYASLRHISIEMAARNLRYAYFEQLRNDIGAEAICVAHHQDDNVETILLNLVRGTGLNGLTGMAPRNGNIIRPMLQITRSDIEDYLKELKQDYVTDSTNLIDDVKRNQIRLDILPLLEKMNPNVKENIATTARYLSEAGKVINTSLDSYWKRKQDIVTYLSNENAPGDTSDLDTSATLSIATIKNYSSPEYLLFYLLQNYNYNGKQVEQIFESIDNGQGKLWTSATHELIIDRENIIIRKISERTDKVMLIPEEGNYTYEDGMTFKLIENEIDDSFKVSKEAHRVTLDADTVKFPVKIRHTHEGDRFIPFGMKGSKLVSDYLTDIKKNIFEKRDQLVFEDAEGKIIWIYGERTDDRVKITKKSKKVLIIKSL